MKTRPPLLVQYKQNTRQLLFVNATLLITCPICKHYLLQMGFSTLSSLPKALPGVKASQPWSFPTVSNPVHLSWRLGSEGSSPVLILARIRPFPAPSSALLWEGCSEQLKLSREWAVGVERALCFFGSRDK